MFFLSFWSFSKSFGSNSSLFSYYIIIMKKIKLPGNSKKIHGINSSINKETPIWDIVKVSKDY